jgi:hypothetical protein
MEWVTILLKIMRKMMEKLMTALLLTSVLLGSVGVYASSQLRKIEAYYNVKDIVINRVSKMPTEQPFTYNGSTYVPLRYISEALGENVDWEASTQSIYIGQRDPNQAYYLEGAVKNMGTGDGEYLGVVNQEKIFSIYHANRTTETNNIGETFDTFLSLRGYSSNVQTIDYPLNGQFKRFRTTIGISDGTKSVQTTTTVKVFGDQSLIKEFELAPGGFPEEIDIDVSNYNKLSFEVRCNYYSSNAIIFGNPYLLK